MRTEHLSHVHLVMYHDGWHFRLFERNLKWGRDWGKCQTHDLSEALEFVRHHFARDLLVSVISKYADTWDWYMVDRGF